jgi:seryl-tRNA synthetase
MRTILNNIINLNVDEMLAYSVTNNITSARIVDMIYDCEEERDKLEKKVEELENYGEYDSACGGFWINAKTQEQIDELIDRINSLDSFMKDAEEVSNILDNQE